MTEQPALTLTGFKSTRDSRLAALLVEYRELVRVLAQDDSMQSDQGGTLDDIMIRLKISDEDLATDIEDTKQHARLSRLITEFKAKQPKLDKQLAKLTEDIAKARFEIQSADRRLAEAQQDRHLAGQLHNTNRGNVRRKQELESRNSRLFGTAKP